LRQLRLLRGDRRRRSRDPSAHPFTLDAREVAAEIRGVDADASADAVAAEALCEPVGGGSVPARPLKAKVPLREPSHS
jgi:hypothetical protein